MGTWGDNRGGEGERGLGFRSVVDDSRLGMFGVDFLVFVGFHPVEEEQPQNRFLAADWPESP